MTTLNVPIQLRRGNQASCPTVMLAGELYVCLDSGLLFAGTGTGVKQVGGGSSSVAWGTITGTLSAQTDLETVLTVIASAVTTETARAEAAEALLATITALTAETTRAEAAEALLAPLASPALTGNPTAPTQAALSADTKIATDAYCDSAVGVEKTRAEAAEALLVSQTTTVNGHALSGNVVVSASDITTGTLPAAQLPNPSASTLGGVESIASAAHQYLVSISTSGVPAAARPVLADLSDTPAQNLVVASPNGSSGALTARALVAADVPTLNQNTSGTAANLSGTPALPNGATATTQTALSADTKIATDAYVDAAVAAGPTTFEGAGNGDFISPYGQTNWPPDADSYTDGLSENNQVFMVKVTTPITIRKASVDMQAGATSGNVYVAMYTTAGNLVANSQAKMTATSSGLKNVTLGTPYTLAPGMYYMYVAIDQAGMSWYYTSWGSNAVPTTYNTNVSRIGTAANNPSGGAVPNTLGNITTQPNGRPLCLLEA